MRWFLIAMLLAVACVGFLLTFVRTDVRGPIGTRLVFDDFAFDVLEARRADELGGVRATGEFCIVRLRLGNIAKRMDHPVPEHRVMLHGSSDETFEVDSAGQRAWETLHAPAAPPAVLRLGDGWDYVRVFDVPRGEKLELGISWGAWFVDAIDFTLFGERRVELD